MTTILTHITPLSEWGIRYDYPLVISGPCSAESEDQVLKTCLELATMDVDVLRAGIWKPRTHPGSFEGVGAPGLSWLKKASQATGLPVIVEVASPEHIHACLDHEIDMMWIGARTTGNPFAIQAIADALKGVDSPVLVKNPMNPDIELWIGAMERIFSAGIHRLGAIHRGFSAYGKQMYRYKPQWQIPNELKVRYPDLPLICDPSHICGRTDILLSVARKAMDLLFDGLMIESHISPKNALSDADQQVTPSELKSLLMKLESDGYDNPEYPEQNIDKLEEILLHFDEQIAELLSERMTLAREIAVTGIKFQSGSDNEQQQIYIRQRLEMARKRGLSEAFTKEFFSIIDIWSSKNNR